MTQGISTIVCCYNSGLRLPETLRHLAALEIGPYMTLEIIIVDNASTDETSKIARDIWHSLPTPHKLRIVYEPVQGLSHARIRGINESHHEIIIFCDDDNWLCPSYAATALEIMDSNPCIALIGGMTEAVFATKEVPAWFDEIAGAYAVGSGEGACEVPMGEIVWGAGMVARKAMLDRLFESGFQFMCSDRQGAMLSGGGDAELCHAMQWIGHTVFHDGRLKLKHWIPSERLTWNYVVRLSKGWGAASIAGDAVRLVQHRHQPIRNFIRKSFIYQVVRSVASLVPRIGQLMTVHREEGNFVGLAATSKLGRLQAIVGLGFSYSKLVTEKQHWLEKNQG